MAQDILVSWATCHPQRNGYRKAGIVALIICPKRAVYNPTNIAVDLTLAGGRSR